MNPLLPHSIVIAGLKRRLNGIKIFSYKLFCQSTPEKVKNFFAEYSK